MALLSARRVLLALALSSTFVAAAPAASPHAAPKSLAVQASSTVSAPAASTTVPYASDDPNGVLWSETSGTKPEPIRGKFGAPILGPQNMAIDLQNPDLLAPPTTDHGSVANAKWPFGMSHNRVQSGGWARQQNVKVMPVADEMAGVNMRLAAGAVRELHWHNTAEWAYVLKGQVQVSAINADGQNYLGTVNPGDLWYFPAGMPHALQATNATAEGAEFLLIFDTGEFSEDSTFSLTDWLQHTPKEVLAKNFQTDISSFDKIPEAELYIFPTTPPNSNAVAPKSPQGDAKMPFTHALSKVAGKKTPGGSVKIVDSSTFPISETVAVAEVTIEPGHMRELHWHPTQDEWSYFIEGTARVTLFASSGNARTFNYQAGDIGYVPASFGHYVENTGNTTVKFLEAFKTDRYQDISLANWLALTSPDLVKAHLGLSDEMMAKLPKTKQLVV